jgi:hypothetical protein
VDEETERFCWRWSLGQCSSRMFNISHGECSGYLGGSGDELRGMPGNPVDFDDTRIRSIFPARVGKITVSARSIA